MAELLDIHEYVHKTAKIIATVLDMEVLICDEKCRILGDSEIDDWNSIEIMSDVAILSKCMNIKEIIILKDRKKESLSCKNCIKNIYCNVKSIITFPILKNDILIGGIGLYIKEGESKKRLMANNESYIGFISKMSDLLIGKLEEKQENIELKAFYRRMSQIVESIDYALIGIDENYNIISCNSKFKKIFNIKLELVNNLEEIYNIIGNYELKEFIENNDSINEKQITFKINNNFVNIIATFDSIFVDNVYKGALIYFKKTTDLYDEVNKITNNQANISFRDILGNSKSIVKLKDDAKNFAYGASTILIQGESGTGKDIFARAIHSESNFKNGPFIAVNCSAIPDNLLESELFGHEEGSFTGSMKGGKIGKFELANRGTLFLDEVGEIPIHLQSKLLRAIQDRKIQRVGSNKDISVEIRIIAATNRELEKMMQSGEFREDLYYRLNVIPLYVPPIRERKSDIQLLLQYFLTVYNRMLTKNIEGFTKEAENILHNYKWPGNVRELQNIVEYSVNMSKRKFIDVSDLPKRIFGEEKMTETVRIRPLDEIEDFYIHEALRIYGNDLQGKERAAKKLGISRATLYRKLKKIEKS